MTQLKTNFAIRTTDENFRTHVETLKALGYEMYDNADSIEGYSYLVMGNPITNCVYRAGSTFYNWSIFTSIEKFLAWYFTPELPQKSEAEILLDSLEEEMQQLQTKIDAVREQMLKEMWEKE